MYECRSEDATIKSGLASLEVQDMQFVKDTRRQRLESFLVTIISKFQPEALLGPQETEEWRGKDQHFDTKFFDTVEQGIVHTYQKVGDSIKRALAANGLE